MAADCIGISEQAISQWERGETEPTRENLIAAADFYGVPHDWLAKPHSTRIVGEIADDDGASIGLKYAGLVEAGAFRPVNLFDQDSEHRAIPIAPDPRYPFKSQGAFRVEGDSMDRARIHPGMWVHAIEVTAWQRMNGDLTDGAMVVVTRIREDKGERELTVKQLRIFRDRMELRPQSSNPAHEPIIMPAEPQEGNEKVYVLAIVISAIWLFGFSG